MRVALRNRNKCASVRFTPGIPDKRRLFMSSKTAFVRIPHNAYVLVGDGRKALFLRNIGSEIAPQLKTEQVFLDDGGFAG